jgi:hypothetical protein
MPVTTRLEDRRGHAVELGREQPAADETPEASAQVPPQRLAGYPLGNAIVVRWTLTIQSRSVIVATN